MKSISRLGIVLTVVVAFPALAAAGSANHSKCKAKWRAEKLARYDANQDGRLDRDEKRLMRAERHREALARYDANGDGRLDRDERAKKKRDRRAAHFARLDTNGDGEISRTEADAACGPLKHRFDTVDTDRSGAISPAEFEAVKRRHHHRWRGKKKMR